MRYMRKLHPYLDILVSNIGEVFVLGDTWHKAHWTFGCKNCSTSYRQVKINGKVYLVHRLVADTFIPNPENKPQVDHISRQKDQNSVDNLRWSTYSENSRNRADHDRIEGQGRTHWYEDEKQYNRERNAHHYAENKDKLCEKSVCYSREKRKTHRRVQFSDGTHHWLPLPEAEAYLIIPLKERNYAK